MPDSCEHKFEHYELVRREDGAAVELGRGAMGVTYKAIDINLKSPVALKILNARYLENELVRQRFVREARAAASLRHPNVASVFHLGKTGEDYFYTMEFVEGESLERVLRFRGPLELDLALEIVDQVAAALSAAYRLNLVHRDIKPDNLMVVFGEAGKVTVKVIDFGLAKALRAPLSEGNLSEVGVFFGTPRFSSPEQCSGEEVDIRSDLYSLGVTLWVMLTGKTPFNGTALEVIQKHLSQAPPVEQLEHVPKPVVSLIESLLEKDPRKRPESPYQLRLMLRQVRETLRAAQTVSVGNWKDAQVSRWRPWFGKRRLILAVGTLIGIAIAYYCFVYQRAPPYVDAKSVAVLPFDNLGDNKQNEYFSEGLTTEVIFQLSKMSDLRVMSRSSVLRYKAVHDAAPKSVHEIGAELGVATILESSVQRLENRVKITTILYDARTDRRLWGEAYDHEIKDLFAIQSDVAQNIAAALHVRLSADELASIQRIPTQNLTAYDLYLRGLAFYELHHKDDNERAIALFRQALEKDSKFSLAYTGLANAYIERVDEFEGEAFWLDSAIDLSQQAIALDPQQVRGYTALARAFSWKGLNDQANQCVRKALELAPNDAEALKRAVHQLSGVAHLDEKYALLRKCHTLSPNDPYAPILLGELSAAVGDKDLAEKWMQRAIDIETDRERHRMMECRRAIFRREFTGALVGLRQLPLGLITHDTTVLELVVACSVRVGDWPTVQRLASARLEKGPGSWELDWDSWALYYLALASRAAGREAEAQEKAEQVVARSLEALARGKTIFWAQYFLALGSRFLERKEEAYQHLRIVFPDVLGVLPLMREDPSMAPFVPDVEFQTMMSDLEKKNEVTRARIREIEKNS
jgi:non-specific serine/threonine protein kinase